MQGTALQLVDKVLPAVPTRQWVLSLPRWARFLLARDPALITRTLELALRAIFTWQRKRARGQGVACSRTGAVTFVQRFGGALNLNVHFHCVLPDGVWVREAGALRFVKLDKPADAEVQEILLRIERRVRKLLKPRVEASRDDARTPDALALSQAESVSALRGKPVDARQAKPLTGFHQGFSLHAGVHLHANDREGLMHLCGYGARPPLTQERLSSLPDGKLAYRLKRPLADGRDALVLEPSELIRRLATLVPPPRAHLVRYHGVFGPASKWRSEVIPKPATPVPSCGPAPRAEPVPSGEAKEERRPSTIPWSELLLRVFREDVLACPCGGRRVVTAFITEKKVIEQILGHLGIPATGPPVAPARVSAAQDCAGWQDDVPELQQALH
jgi:hypothetical protein